MDTHRNKLSWESSVQSEGRINSALPDAPCLRSREETGFLDGSVGEEGLRNEVKTGNSLRYTGVRLGVRGVAEISQRVMCSQRKGEDWRGDACLQGASRGSRGEDGIASL